MSTLGSRIARAMRLDAELYEEVENDPSLTGQAALVVVLSSLAAGIGSFGRAGVMGLVIGAVVALVGWYIWAFITYFIGTRLLPEPQTRADHGELLRTLGFASAPGLLRILGVVPGLGALVFFLASIWMLAATVVAVRQALDYTSTLRAIGVCVIGWLVQAFLFGLLFAVWRGSI